MKSLIWIIGKPGSGKSSVGHYLASETGMQHFSFGRLLAEVQPTPPRLDTL